MYHQAFTILLAIILRVLLLFSVDPDSIIPLKMTEYIKSAITKGDSFFSEGFIICGNDTIGCKIFIKNKNSEGFDKTMFSFVVVKLQNDSVIGFTAAKINGFFVNNNRFRSHTSDVFGKQRSFFIRQIEKGFVILYERNGYLLDRSLKYYMHYGNTEYYTVIDPETQNLLKETDPGGQLVEEAAGIFNIHTQQLPDKFRLYFSNIFKDCKTVSSKILSEFYTINDLDLIVKEYNSCRNK